MVVVQAVCAPEMVRPCVGLGWVLLEAGGAGRAPIAACKVSQKVIEHIINSNALLESSCSVALKPPVRLECRA